MSDTPTNTLNIRHQLAVVVKQAHDRSPPPQDPIQQLAAELAKRIVAETKALDPRDNILVGDVIEKHLRYCKDEVCAEQHYNRSKRLRDFAALHGKKRIEECTPIDLQEFMDRPSWKSGRTRNSARAQILRCFNWARKSRLIRENPFDGCPKAAEGPGGRPLKDQLFLAIMRNTKPHFRRLLIFIRFTGCRPCEANSLRWQNIVWDKCMAVLPHHKTAKKTGKPRILYLHPVVMKLLRWIQAQRTPEPAALWMARILRSGPIKTRELARLARIEHFTTRQVYRAIRTVGARLEWRRMPGNEADLRCRHKTRIKKVYVLDGEPRLPKVDDPGEFVFLTLKQTAWNRRSIGTMIYRLYKAGKLPAGVRTYGLRHRAATEAIRAGVSILIVSKLLGHCSVLTTQHYCDTIAEDTELILGELVKVPQMPNRKEKP